MCLANSKYAFALQIQNMVRKLLEGCGSKSCPCCGGQRRFMGTWPSRRVGGSTPVRARIASACSGGGARRAARGALSVRQECNIFRPTPMPPPSASGVGLSLWGGGRRCGVGGRHARAGLGRSAQACGARPLGREKVLAGWAEALRCVGVQGGGPGRG